MTLFLAFGVKEKVILENNHKAKVPFVKGFKAVLKNKYYWIQNLSNLPTLFTTGAVALANIIFIYVSRQEWLLGVYAGITGTAYIPGMLLAPLLIKKLGKRKIVIIARVAQIIAGVAITFSAVIGNIPLFIIFNYIALFTNAPTVVVNSAITADVWDYQQYKTGERLDGCAGIFGLLMTPLSTLGAFVIPFLYEAFNFTTDWDIMYVPELRNPILWLGTIAGTVVGVLSLIPWFFYDLTEKKHGEMMEELKRRAMLANGDIDGKELIEDATQDMSDATENYTLDCSSMADANCDVKDIDSSSPSANPQDDISLDEKNNTEDDSQNNS